MNKKLLILGGALIAVLGSGAGVYFLYPEWLPGFIRPKVSAAAKPGKREEEKKREPEVGADLDVFVVNLAGSGPARYLRTTLSLGVKSEKEKEIVKESNGPVRDAIIMYLSDRKVEELLDPAAKAKLRADIRKQVNTAIGQAIVSNVYFKEFLIQ
jgi:flagellar basal body-associated protein FliL